MTAYIATGKSLVLQPTDAASNVTYSPTVGNTFRIVNNSMDTTVYVNVFNNSTDAAAIQAAWVDSPATGIQVYPGAVEFITGDFAVGNSGSVYVAAICNSGASTTVYITPVRITG